MNDVVLTETKDQPLWFTASVIGAAGAFFGLFVGTAQGSGLGGVIVGFLIAAALGVAAIKLLGTEMEKTFKYGLIAIFLVAGFAFGGLAGLIVMGLFAWFLGWFIYWIGRQRYREFLPPYLTAREVLWHYTFRVLCGAVLVFLITPILVVMPLSFNAENFFTFTPEMLRLDPDGYSLRHYRDFLTNPEWTNAVWNSVRVAPVSTLIAVTLGTLAAIGLSQSHVPGRQAIMAILISPMIVPLIISATGMYFFYSKIGIVGTYWGVVLAHAVLGIPFVIITVTATLVGFDKSLVRASANLGANPVRTFFKVQMPLILPGVISGGLFAFITSFDEVVVVIFIGSAELQTLPWQMFTGLREQISPTILAAATILVCISIALLSTVEILRRRSEKLRGLSPS
ncbi:putative spermidine/putrescine transport system permease protein [Roseivivax halotolerans]|jgi:putative spermidine/putrescine transport system permease protein|uniref:Putative spermidine/putrescine transport system permease protein n=1 Tax=Roseivivax halotolerans TaxID=93684 RepID=A0A1I5Z0Z0_9RHOB|nr:MULTISPECIES: ABC transporter permease [Roseivivax]QFT61479.1 Inner membrane ABC transporter permease protein YdcV [Roseivivax sp. THAF30]SFQ50089.1 putative spermidine/putrescine transport system permease protein [Roseivivax halotolerans]